MEGREEEGGRCLRGCCLSTMTFGPIAAAAEPPRRRRQQQRALLPACEARVGRCRGGGVGSLRPPVRTHHVERVRDHDPHLQALRHALDHGRGRGPCARRLCGLLLVPRCLVQVGDDVALRWPACDPRVCVWKVYPVLVVGRAWCVLGPRVLGPWPCAVKDFPPVQALACALLAPMSPFVQ